MLSLPRWKKSLFLTPGGYSSEVVWLVEPLMDGWIGGDLSPCRRLCHLVKSRIGHTSPHAFDHSCGAWEGRAGASSFYGECARGNRGCYHSRTSVAVRSGVDTHPVIAATDHPHVPVTSPVTSPVKSPVMSPAID